MPLSSLSSLSIVIKKNRIVIFAHYNIKFILYYSGRFDNVKSLMTIVTIDNRDNTLSSYCNIF